MILYGATLSPFVRKVVAFAAEKGIELDLRPTGQGFGQPSAEFLAASPARKMPALVDGDYALADSSAIVHYLDALHPDPALIPADPQARGKTVWWDEYADTLIGACMGKLFFNRIVAPLFMGRDGDAAAADAAERDELPPILAYLDGELAGRDYLVGDRLTLADLAVGAMLANFAHLGIDFAATPNLSRYAGAILSRPCFAASLAQERALLARLRG